MSLSRETDSSGSVGLIAAVRLWRRLGPVSRIGNLVIYEDCLVFAAVSGRETGWSSRIAGRPSTLDAQLLRVGHEQMTVEPQRLALRSRRNLIIHRDRVEFAKLTQMRVSGAGGGDDVVSGVLGLIADVGARTRRVLSIKSHGVRMKLTIEGTWGAPECEWLKHALGDKLVTEHG